MGEETDTVTSSPLRSQLGKWQDLLRGVSFPRPETSSAPVLAASLTGGSSIPQCYVVLLQLWRTPHPLVPARPNIMSMPLSGTSVMKDLPSTMWLSSGAGAMASGIGPKLSAPNVSGCPKTPQHRFSTSIKTSYYYTH